MKQLLLHRFRLFITLCAVLSVASLAGCRAFSVPQEPPKPTPLEPIWSERALEEHLDFFNDDDVKGRGTGSVEFATVAAYVAARMREFRLQPVVEGGFSVVYETPLNQPRAARLFVPGPDSLLFLPLADYLVDGRSDSGGVALRAVMINPQGGALREAVMVPKEQASDSLLAAVRATGATAAFLVGQPAPHRAQRRVAGLLTVQLSLAAAARLLGVPVAEVQVMLARDEATTLTLPLPIQLSVDAAYRAQAEALNIIGYVPGKHPARHSELLIVCADLDGWGRFAGLRALDLDHFGLGTAALLEVARNAGYLSRFHAIPERSVMFAVWSGARSGHLGLRAYLRNPSWDLDRTVGVVYVGLEEAEAPAVRALLDAYGLPLYAVPLPSASLRATDGPALFLESSLRRQAARRRGPQAASEPPAFDLIIKQAVPLARDLAAVTYDWLLAEAITPAPFMPAIEDTLAVPPNTLE